VQGCEGKTSVNVIADQALKRLEHLAHVGEALSTDQVREVLDLTSAQFHRMTLQDDFPKRAHIGRKYWLNPEKLLAFCLRWNQLAAGLTITDVARLIHATVPTARRIVRQAGFPTPLGEVNGKPRWDQDELQAWHAPRVEGSKLPAPVSAGTPKGKKKAVGKAKEKRDGKAKDARAH
jgi:predicted DNA-binding transcriptional regulator AlpA